MNSPISSSGVASQKELQPSLASREPKTFYLSNVNKGYVLAFKDKGSYGHEIVIENAGVHDAEQKWTVDYGDEPDTIALKNVATGKYLRCLELKTGGDVAIGDKYWWKTSVAELTVPGACRIQAPGGRSQYFLENRQGNGLRKGQSSGVCVSYDVVRIRSRQD
jgi:hypothetical protein